MKRRSLFQRIKNVYYTTAKGNPIHFLRVIHAVIIYKLSTYFFRAKQFLRTRKIKKIRMEEIAELLASSNLDDVREGYRSLFILNPQLFQTSADMAQKYINHLLPTEHAAERAIIQQRLKIQSAKPLVAPSPKLREAISRPLIQVPIVDYLSERGSTLRVFRDRGSMSVFAAPRIGSFTPDLLGTLEVPESSICYVENVLVVPGFCVIDWQSKLIVHEPAAEFKNRQSVSGLGHLFDTKDLDRNRLTYKGRVENQITLEEGILLGGRNSTNYFHWSIEYLARLLEVSLAGLDSNIPLIVSDEMPIQHYQMLDKLNTAKRPIVFTDSETAIEIKKLWIPSTHTYTPDDFTNDHWRTSAMSADHLNFLRQGLTSSRKSPHKIIYLARLQLMRRNIVNEAKLINSLKSSGVKVILPELFTLDQQIALFRDADVIIGSCGAALANSIFRRSNSVLHMIISEGIANFTLFSNMHFMSGGRCFRIVGKPTKPRWKFSSDEDYAHSKFSIPKRTIQDLSKWISDYRGL